MGRAMGPGPGEVVAAPDAVNAGEHDNYLALVVPAMAYVWEDDTHPEVMKMLRQAGSQADILADATMAIVRRALKSSSSVPAETVLRVAMEVLDDLVELADVAMIFRSDAQVTNAVARRVRAQLTH